MPKIFEWGPVSIYINTRGLTVEGPGGIDFCPDVLRFWCETGKVLSPEETAAYFEMTFSGGLAA